MVKTYLKFEQTQKFGVVASPSANAVWTEDPASLSQDRQTGAGRAYVSANEDVLCWDIKKGELLSRWHDSACSAQVTAITRSKTDSDIFAVGYADGSIRLWDARIASVVIRFDGHRSAVTILTFDKVGVRLASGSRDTDIIVWDLIAESGLFKLRGHKDQITGLEFVQPSQPDVTDQDDAKNLAETYILSTSKDALVKIWDVSSQYCLETHVTQSNGECWSLGLSPDGNGCITGGNDGELKVWVLDTEALREHASKVEKVANVSYLIGRGTIYRHNRDRTTRIHFHSKVDFVAFHGSEKAIELWRMRGPAEVQKSLARKRRRKKEKASGSEGQDVDGDTAMQDSGTQNDPSTASVSDVFALHVIVRTGGKVRSIDWALSRGNAKAIGLLVSTTNNQLEIYSIDAKPPRKKSKTEEAPDYNRTQSVDLPGHRTEVRAVALSSDDGMLATASNGSLKIWNTRTRNCLRTLDCGYALSCAFLPGDKIVILGNNKGELELFDIASSTPLETVKAHEGAVWSLKCHPDGKSVATGSADKTVKFLRFDIVQDEIPGTRRTTPRLRLNHTRTLKLADDILSLAFSPDARLLAVSTLDNMVKTFFSDSLKLYQTLYGHKLPVLNLTISSDSKLIATCSADKNIKIWGLDHGDCHRSLFAHDDAIMAVSFIPDPPTKEDAHLLFSASKDGLLKTWDADRFLPVQRLRGHHSDILAMAVSRTGAFAITSSRDKSTRLWSLSDEPLFLEEERERELEELHDANLTTALDRDAADEEALTQQQRVDADGDPLDPDDAAITPTSKQTGATLTAGEKITEALGICIADLEAARDHSAHRDANPDAPPAPPQRHPILAFHDTPPELHLLRTFERIPTPSLQDALLLLPFSTLPPLFVFLDIWVRRHVNVPLACRVLFFLLRVHHKQVVASGELRSVLESLREGLRECLGEWRGVVGFNAAGLRVMSEWVGERGVRRLEDVEGEEMGERGKKRAFVNVA